MTEKSQKGQTTPLENVTVKINMKLIDPFPNHPFYVIDDDEMYELTESIRKNGLITPIIVRQKNERYELIAGHRRKHACESLGHTEIACRVVVASDDEAIIMMVDSNCQRTKILPSERAYAYKMKLEAMKRQGRRTDLTSAQVAQKSARKTSRQILAEQEGQSQDQIRRYVRLTNLVPELLEFVDLEKIKLCPAVELSYLDEETQRDIVDQIDETDAFPSHAQTIRIDNISKGLKQWRLDDVDKLPRDGSVTLLDTRTVGEFRRGHIEGFRNIPVDELRDRIGEVESGKPVYVICQSGLRSYIATRILEGYGFEAYNFAGGFRFYDAVMHDRALIEQATPCGMDK